jgi:hypothetical protein
MNIKLETGILKSFEDTLSLGDKVLETLKTQPNIKKALFYDNTNSAGDWTGIVIIDNTKENKEKDFPPYDLCFFYSNPEEIIINESEPFDRTFTYELSDETIFEKVDTFIEFESFLDECFNDCLYNNEYDYE